MGGTGIFGWLGDSLFGASPYTPTQVAPNITPTPPGGYGGGSLAGLLDPRGIREQAAWAGLGALSQGLLAAGMRRPAASPSPLPQALGAFGPAYQGALQSGYQTAGAEQQFRQREAAERTRLEREQAWQTALAAATPAERALMQQMGPDQWGQMQGNVQAALRRPTVVGADSSLVIPGTSQVLATTPPRPQQPQLVGSATEGYRWVYPPAAEGQPPAPGGAQPPAPGGTQPGGAPSGQPAPTGGPRVPVGIRNNNWLAMSPGAPPPGSPPGTPPPVAQYETPEIGIAAASQNLDRLFPSGTVTPRQLVQTWAQGPNYDPARVTPGIRASVENYGTAVARAAGVSNPDQPINLRDPATRLRVMRAMGQFETGGLPQGAEAVIARGVALAADPRYMPSQAAPARSPTADGGARAPAPAAQAPTQGGYVAPGPVPQVSAEVQALFDRARQPPAPPPQAQAPQAQPPQAQPAAPPPRPGGPRTVEAIPPRPVDPLHLGGQALDAQMRNLFNQLDDIREERPLTPQEQRSYSQARDYLMTPRVQPDGSTYYPGEPASRRSGGGAPAQAAPPTPAGGAPAPAAAPPAAAAPPPADSRPPSQVARPGEPAVPDGMYRTRAGSGYVDRPLQQQPATVVTQLSTNASGVQRMDRALTELNAYEGAVGIGPGAASVTQITQMLYDRNDPRGVRVRAAIADIGSLKIHDRSGASVTVSESPRLSPFIPSVGDSPEVIREKLANLRAAIIEDTGGLYGNYGPQANYRPLPDVERALASTPPAPPERPAPPPPPAARAVRPPMQNGELDLAALNRAGPNVRYEIAGGTYRWVPGTAGRQGEPSTAGRMERVDN